MLEVLDSCKRKACVFHLTPVDEALPVGQPHVGGLPDLPADLEWPKNRDGQLQFLAQLPLDPAREAGILPIEASPESLLYIFASCRSDQASTVPGPAFLCTASQKLTRRTAGNESYVHSWYKVLPEIVEEFPCWEEMVEIFASEIGLIDRKVLTHFGRLSGKIANTLLKPSRSAVGQLGSRPRNEKAPCWRRWPRVKISKLLLLTKARFTSLSRRMEN